MQRSSNFQGGYASRALAWRGTSEVYMQMIRRRMGEKCLNWLRAEKWCHYLGFSGGEAVVDS